MIHCLLSSKQNSIRAWFFSYLGKRLFFIFISSWLPLLDVWRKLAFCAFTMFLHYQILKIFGVLSFFQRKTYLWISNNQCFLPFSLLINFGWLSCGQAWNWYGRNLHAFYGLVFVLQTGVWMYICWCLPNLTTRTVHRVFYENTDGVWLASSDTVILCRSVCGGGVIFFCMAYECECWKIEKKWSVPVIFFVSCCSVFVPKNLNFFFLCQREVIVPKAFVQRHCSIWEA